MDNAEPSEEEGICSVDNNLENEEEIKEEQMSADLEEGEVQDEDDLVISESRGFEVDVSQIKSITEDEQADEIKNLGLKVYDQEILEQGIWDQVEEQAKRKEAQEELASVQAKLKRYAQNQQLYELKPKEKPNSQSFLRDALLKPKEKSGVKQPLDAKLTKWKEKKKEVDRLKSRKLELKSKLSTMGHLGKESEINEESERERRIRLGEMTPFGTSVQEEKSDLLGFNNYFKNQEKLRQKMLSNNALRKNDLKNTKCSVTKTLNVGEEKKPTHVSGRKIIKSKKHHRKEELWTPSSETAESKPRTSALVQFDKDKLENSGSEYAPSESDEEDCKYEFDGPKRKRRKRDVHTENKEKLGSKKRISHKQKMSKKSEEIDSVDPENWASDDSDWVCTDDELSDSGEGLKPRRKVKREVDDGNDEDFFRRVHHWEKQNEGLREQMTEDCHELENGFKIPRLIWEKLYKYQRVGAQWLWELNQQQCGGILGDEMGLGKTIQVIAFLAGLSISGLKCRSTGFRGLGPTLIVCPTTLMHQWVKEFHTWFPPIRVAILHESGCFVGKRANLITNIVNCRGVLITSYTAIIKLKDALLSPRWHYIILDEGHKIRNPDAQATLVVKQLRTPHRIILSGSPLQNNLRELWSLMDFVFPGKLGTLPVFMQEFSVPITQGGYANASEVMVATAFKCATVLRDTIAPYLLRRMKSDVNDHIRLPSKSEQVLFCRLTDEQRDLYKGYLSCGEVARILDGRAQIFIGLINLRKICNHPHLYSGGPKLFANDKLEDIPVEDRYGFWNKAGKMIVVESLLKIWRRQEHRVLIFTQSKQMLLILESFIAREGYTYLKLDGGTSIAARQPLINKFNEDKTYFIMLLTTKVGGLGVNLTGANRVIIYDPDWNPATDTQARERAWRIGQQNAVTVYRLITAGTIEEKMYHRQIFKQFLCNKVLKDPRQRRFFKSNDLLELFTFKETDTECTETSAIFAGTGSQVRVSKGRSSKRQKLEEPSETFVENKFSKKSPKGKSLNSGSKHASPPKVCFSEDKLERMKRLARELSMKISRKPCTVASEAKDSVLVVKEEQTTVNEVPILKSTINVDVSENDEAKPTENEEPVPNSTIILKDELILESDDDDLENIKLVAQELGEELSEKVSIAAAINKNECAAGSVEAVQEDDEQSGQDISDDRFLNEEQIKREVNDPEPVVGSTEMDDENKLAQVELQDISGSSSKTELPEKIKSSHSSKSKKRKKRKRSKKRNVIFEGERISNLVGSESYDRKTEAEMKEEEAHNAKQDDYVLRKLFAKTGLQTAMQHDKIMEGGHADYALVEGEARRVAQEAVKAMKESRRQCWSATAGVPTWTGSSGTLRPSESKRKFGQKKKLQRTSVTKPDEAKTSEETGSNALLARIRARNLLLQENEDNEAIDVNAVPDSNKELLDDIRTFVSFGASVDGRATTDELVTQFRDRLPPESSALFKQLLMQICEFHRLPSGLGVWKLTPGFRW